MSAVTNLAAPKPGDLRRRALEELLGRIDAILAELDGHRGSGVDDPSVALPAAEAGIPIAT